MPQDYNIYIRNINTGGQSDPTRPWSNDGVGGELQPTVAWNPQNVQAVAQGVGLGFNPNQLANMGRGQMSKLVPAIATAFAVIKLSEKVFNVAHSFYAETLQRQSGDFGVSIRWNNLRQLYQNITNPFETMLNIAREEDARRIENERKNLQLALLGETMVNRGV